MNFFDKIGQWMNESGLIGMSSDQVQMYKTLKGFYAVDTPISTGNVASSTPKKQIEQNGVWTLAQRNQVFNKIDSILGIHLASTIKDIIVSDCFNDMCGGYTVSAQYVDDEKPEVAKLFNDSIAQMVKRTNIVEILKDCVTNDGMNYGEIFLSTKCEYGKGIVSISDDLEIRNLLAIYKNAEFVGAMEFQIKGKDGKDTVAKKFIQPEFISHFMLNYKKVPIRIAKGFDQFYKTSEKIRCAKPILTDVVDLILQYNVLEQIVAAVEINKATQPVFLGIGVSPDQDLQQISQNLQDWSNVLNKNKNNVVNSLESLDATTILQSSQQIELVPYSQDEGTNTMRQISINYSDSNLTDKINDLRKTIAMAVGLPESYLSTTTLVGAKDSKEESLQTSPRYARMLTRIQQLLGKGIKDLIYKHLKYKFSNSEGVLTRHIDPDKIEVLFNSATNLNDRLEDENLLLNAETMNNLLGVIDSVATSQNIHVKVDTEKFLDMWKKQLYKSPEIRDIFVKMTEEEIKQQTMAMMGDMGMDMGDEDDEIPVDAENQDVDMDNADNQDMETDKDMDIDKDGEDKNSPKGKVKSVSKSVKDILK